ncbi:ABC transporter permease [Aeromicrobium wangtongii]|uniref:ABC transporter permease n=1 Tax=Aeromicrobium wangtongii TaxID=2969247 RepID=A0ABY5M9X1_9ACTN|nr:ABC transporter permease [Aeromicrobium wangtongii]MCD9199398.1 ABC transporter permease [Aeromicrobium wangtongii]MCL3817152.1 ABC transporter permease [Aeromicrobium wangtongii]UUP13754.1 ABC transporter permease [Aeromicrobium wangtongii]
MASAEVLAPIDPPSAESPRRRGGLSPFARYMLVRIGLVIPMLWVLVTMVFLLMRVIGDPVTAAQGGRLNAEQIAERKAEAGLDRPLLTQYWEYISGLLRGDFGTTLTDHRSISGIIVEYGAATLELSFWALIVAFAVGIPLGRLAARYRDRLPDVLLRLFAIFIYAAPVFFVGLLLKLAFTPFGWPSSGRASTQTDLILDNVHPHTNIMIVDALLWGDPKIILEVLQYAVLPAFALGLLTGGVFLRLVRINLLQTLRMDYVTAARARGVSERRVVRKHAMRNALVPVVTVMGMQIALLLAGAVLTETTFEWKGIGYMLTQYLKARDFLAVQGIVTAIAVVVCVASVVIDAIIALVDPRVRF